MGEFEVSSFEVSSFEFRVSSFVFRVSCLVFGVWSLEFGVVEFGVVVFGVVVFGVVVFGVVVFGGQGRGLWFVVRGLVFREGEAPAEPLPSAARSLSLAPVLRGEGWGEGRSGYDAAMQRATKAMNIVLSYL
jgi:hypothetical protein